MWYPRTSLEVLVVEVASQVCEVALHVSATNTRILVTIEISQLSCKEVFLIIGQTVSKYEAESITTDAGCFSPIGFCQLHAKQFCMQLTKAYGALPECPLELNVLQSVVID